LGVFAKKVQKSDFPRKRSQNLKKSFQFVTIKKNFFFGNFFADLNFGHTFLCPFFTFAKTFPKKWIFGFFVFFVYIFMFLRYTVILCYSKMNF
jgi:hypothetical protein